MDVFFGHNYKVTRSGTAIFLKEGEKNIVEIFVDVTDSRLTIKSISEQIAKKGLEVLVNYLETNFGGKHIFSLPKSLQSHFIALGYTLGTQTDSSTVKAS